MNLRKTQKICTYYCKEWAWGSVVVKVLRYYVVGRSPVQSPITSLGIFSEASDKSMCPESTQSFEMRTRIFLGVKTAGA
jgi:hypothetical protein